ncbi:MAG: 2,5-diamino-6-ribosylamino-4(3H)-pyrimidinone 5'-phosphate reductase [Acidimicrobiaceae bacterium]|nr:2,5-diamino-6-ribosylamino-4(3H)-pyrimidinone 5'-phosphate reductase [Acidimicrobiaceae bacterium]
MFPMPRRRHAVTVRAVRQVFPPDSGAADLDPVDLVHDDVRQTDGTRPWVLMNMIASADGATAVDGTSGGLGGDADRRLLGTLRGLADVILVGAGTARAENYRAPRTPDDRVGVLRATSGRPPRPRLALVSASLALDPTALMFRPVDPADPPPLIYTATGAPGSARDSLADVAEVVDAGSGDRVDVGMAMADLAARGVGVVLAEGGPSLNHQLVAAGLVDELNLTISPLLTGGTARRILSGPALTAPAGLRLDRVLTADGFLFCRYLTA